VDRGHRRRGLEPKSLDRGGAATEGIRQVNRQRGIAAESGERGSRERAGAMRVRLCEGLRGGAQGPRRYRLASGGWRWLRAPTGLSARSRPCRAGPRAWPAAEARPAPLGRASPGPSHTCRAGREPGQKTGLGLGLTGPCFMYIYSSNYTCEPNTKIAWFYSMFQIGR
jgi:hypothetical protein